MTCNQDVTSVQAVFLADSHFHVQRGPAEEARLRSFCDLLRSHRKTPHVVLLGDIFDFWFDYPHFYMKGYEPILQALDEVTGRRRAPAFRRRQP